MENDIKQVWEQFHKELKSFIKRRINNQSDADDILQEVFEKIIINIEKVNQAKNQKQYLYGIVKNTINDYYRKRKYAISDKDLDNVNVFVEDEVLSLNEIIAIYLKSLIKQLPKIYQEAVYLTQFQNISQKDLAIRLNISYSGAKSRVQRGKEILKKMLLDCCNFQSDIYGNIIDVKCNNCSISK